MKYCTAQINVPRLYSNDLVSLFREFEEDARSLVVSERQCGLWVKSTIGTGSIFWTFESAVSHGNIFTIKLLREVPLWKTMSISTRDQNSTRTYFWIPKPLRFSFTQESNCLSPMLSTFSRYERSSLVIQMTGERHLPMPDSHRSRPNIKLPLYCMSVWPNLPSHRRMDHPSQSPCVCRHGRLMKRIERIDMREICPFTSQIDQEEVESNSFNTSGFLSFSFLWEMSG
jgi:hypothetical protein